VGRGVSFVFGKKVVDNFMEKHGMDLVVRAHQVVAKGYEFFAKRKLVTVFSAPNYMNEFDNSGAGKDSISHFFLSSLARSGVR